MNGRSATLCVLVHLVHVVSRIGIAIKSSSTGTYLNVRTLRLERVDRRRKSDYVFGYEWNREKPYGFGLYTGMGHVTVDGGSRKLVLNGGGLQGGVERMGADSMDFRFHFVTPVKCNSAVIGHSGQCMMDGGRGEIELSGCPPLGEEPSRFHFVVKVFKRFPIPVGPGGSRGDQNMAGIPVGGLVDRIVEDIRRSKNPSMTGEEMRRLVRNLLRDIETPGKKVTKRAEEIDDETDDSTEEGCREREDPSDETEDTPEPGCAAGEFRRNTTQMQPPIYPQHPSAPGYPPPAAPYGSNNTNPSFKRMFKRFKAAAFDELASMAPRYPDTMYPPGPHPGYPAPTPQDPS